MMPRTILASLAVVALASACGGEGTDAVASDESDEVSAEAALRTSATPGTFRMYDEPDHVARARGCDLFVELELNKASVRLRNRVEGICRIAVSPRLRTYRLKETTTTSDPCNTRVFEGAQRINGGRRSVKISDYRFGTCDQRAPAAIVLEETEVDGTVTTSYSGHIAAPAPGTPRRRGALLTTRATLARTRRASRTR